MLIFKIFQVLFWCASLVGVGLCFGNRLSRLFLLAWLVRSKNESPWQVFTHRKKTYMFFFLCYVYLDIVSWSFIFNPDIIRHQSRRLVGIGLEACEFLLEFWQADSFLGEARDFGALSFVPFLLPRKPEAAGKR